MLLFFDTETSGLPRSHHAPVSDLANWPRIVQIACLLTDQQCTTHQAVEAIIRPEGFSIPDDAARVHGIPTALCQLPGRYGYKWPRLNELHRHLFGRGMGAAHNALVDVQACARCFFELQRRGVIA
ncbi:MAG: hypothetical protein WBN89_04710 [Prochlorococcaceae cyanobacterium]